MDMLVGALKSKTVWANVLMAGLTLVGGEPLKSVITPEHLVLIQTGLNIALRFITTTSLEEKSIPS